MSFLIFLSVLVVYWLSEPAISSLCYAIASIFSYDTDTVALISGALSGIMAMLAYILAYWLCKKWQKHKERKAPKEASIESPPELLVMESPAKLPTPGPSRIKARFCKLCGAPIDPATSKCTGCGKQYFNPPIFRKQHLFIGAGVLAFVAAALLIFTLASRLSAAKSQIEALNIQISELQGTVAEQERQIKVYKSNESSYRSQLDIKENAIEILREKNNLMSYEIAFYDRHVVFVADDGTNKYHNYSCEYLDLSYFWAYNTKAAEDRGFKPCPYCCD